MTPYCRGDDLDRGLREILSSADWEVGWSEENERLLGFVFKHQDDFRLGLRRLIQDVHVGKSARNWLELLGDPADRDLFPKGRRFVPKHEVKEADLVEALKAASRHFSANAEPRIDIDFISFTKDLDRVMIQCGINLAPFSGVVEIFIFQRVGNQWVLRSTDELGRG